MTRQFLSVWAVLLLGLSPGSYADEAEELPAASETEYHRLNHTDTPGADRWCILQFIENSRQERYVTGARSAQPHSTVYRATGYSLAAAPPAYTDASSLVSRLNALRDFRLATVWRGKQSELVFGVDDAGYLGLHLEDALSSGE